MFNSVKQDFAAIKLSNSDEFAILDYEDYKRLGHRSWCKQPNGYVTSRAPRENGKRVTRSMHHQVLGPCPHGMITDHINGDRLDNRKSNLRFCSQSQNRQNASKHPNCHSKYKGVSLLRGKYWRVMIGHEYLGNFKNEEEAAEAYDRAAVVKFGDYAKLNFPEKREKYVLGN